MITNAESQTQVDEVADGIYRISTPVPPQVMPGGFSFNQFLLAGDEPLLFHTGPRKLFPLVSEAVAAVLPLERLRWVSFSHVEADECGSLNQFLARCPLAQPLCGELAAMVQMNDLADRPPRTLGDGEEIAIGRHRLRWLYTPHLPHGWECGYLYEATTNTLLCGDLFTQPGHQTPALTSGDILGPSEAMRAALDAFAHGRDQAAHLERLAALAPTTLACMHGSTYQGDGAALLRAQARALEDRPAGARAA
jgi:flavorubredoxin